MTHSNQSTPHWTSPLIGIPQPEGWAYLESMTLFRADNQANVIASSDDVDPKLDTASFTAERTWQLEQSMNGYVEHSLEPVETFGAGPGFMRVFEWADEGGVRISNIQTYFVENGRAYTATATVPSPLFGSSRVDLLLVINGIALQANRFEGLRGNSAYESQLREPRFRAMVPAGWLYRHSVTVKCDIGNVIASTEPLAGGIDTARYAAIQGDLLRAEFRGFVELDFQRISTFGGQPGLLRIFEWIPPSTDPVRQVQIYTVARSRGFTATGTANTTDFPYVEHHLQAVISGITTIPTERFEGERASNRPDPPPGPSENVDNTVGTYAAAHTRDAFLCDERGDYAGAERAIVDLIKAGDVERGASAAFELGIRREAKGDELDAERCFRTAVESRHQEWAPRAAVSLGLLRARRGDRWGAEEAWQLAVTSSHTDFAPAAAFHVGMLRTQSRDYRGAELAFQIAVKSGHPDWAPKARDELRAVAVKPENKLRGGQEDEPMTSPPQRGAAVTLALEYAARSDRGLDARVNEDSVYAGPRLLAVADGYSGRPAGELASQIAIAGLAHLDDDRPADGPVVALQTAVVGINDAIAQHIADEPEVAGMRTTLTALLFDQTVFGIAHIGDSRAYVARSSLLRQITRDERTGPGWQGTSGPARALTGAKVAVRFDDHPAAAGDRYLVCSDGLFDAVAHDEIVRIMKRNADCGTCADRLVEAALRRSAGNVSVIVANVVSLDNEPGIALEVVDLDRDGRAETIVATLPDGTTVFLSDKDGDSRADWAAIDLRGSGALNFQMFRSSTAYSTVDLVSDGSGNRYVATNRSARETESDFPQWLAFMQIRFPGGRPDEAAFDGVRAAVTGLVSPAPEAPQSDWLEGGIYASAQDDGTFTILKILALDEHGVHVRMYSNVFRTLPDRVDEQSLYMAGINRGPDEALGVGHLPVSRKSFADWGAVFLQESTVAYEELAGYLSWKRAGGGYF